MSVLIAEDLLLLLLDDETGKPIVGQPGMDNALARAMLVELAALGKVDVADEQDAVRSGRLVVRDPSPTGDARLDRVLQVIADKQGSKPERVLGPVAKHLRQELLDGLAQRGVLREDKGQILGIFPTTRWPAQDSTHEAGIRAALDQALLHNATPKAHIGALISLLAALEVVPKVVSAPDRRALKRRAKEISEGQWAATAVRQAVQAVNSAVTTAVVVNIAASAGSTGS